MSFELIHIAMPVQFEHIMDENVIAFEVSAVTRCNDKISVLG